MNSNTTKELIARLEVLSDAVTKGRAGIEREFYMSIPARPDHDADLVLSAAAMELKRIDRTNTELNQDIVGRDSLEARNRVMVEALEKIADRNQYHPKVGDSSEMISIAKQALKQSPVELYQKERGVIEAVNEVMKDFKYWNDGKVEHGVILKLKAAHKALLEHNRGGG